MDQHSPAYYLHREQVERAAAEAAVSDEARKVHQELAWRYADLAGRPATPGLDASRAARQRLTLVTAAAPGRSV